MTAEREADGTVGADRPGSWPQGVRRMRPDDHFMVVAETDASPMHVGALLYLDVPPGERAGLAAAMRRQLAERLAATPLLCRLVPSPDGYDSDIWADLAACELDYHVTPVPLPGGDDAAIRAFVAKASMDRLDLSRPPFRMFVLEGLAHDRAALYFKMHHSVADGIGFQTVLGLLSDEQPPVSPRRSDAPIPDATQWRLAAQARFEREAAASAAHKQHRQEAKAGLAALRAAGEPDRPVTPLLKRSTPTSMVRAYATLSLPLERVKAVAQALEATVNDIFLALAGTALRTYLIEVDDLPETPLVINSARSYRQPHHGEFGNRIVALHPHIATNLADPLARLRAIQAEMAREKRRTAFDEAMLDAPDTSYGARDRRDRFGQRLSCGAPVLPGNITLSNVPGRRQVLHFAGYAVLANFPVPILGSGRFLNITSRRNADRLDLGIMTDAEKVEDAGHIAQLLENALLDYEHVAP